MGLRDKAKAVVELPNQINRMTAVVITIGIVSVLAFMMASIALGRITHAN